LIADNVEPPLICMGYQLFSALAGTLADAKTAGSGQAVLLIMEYVTDLTHDDLHVRNGHVLDNFLHRLLGSGVARAQVPSGWITASCPIHGDGTWSAPSTDVSFAKLVRNRRAGA
jgi:hypothetical protein